MCDFDRYCQIPLRGRGPLTLPQAISEGAVSPHPCQLRVLLSSLSLAKLSGTNWHLTVVLICISVVMRKDEHLSCVSVTCTSSSVTCFVSIAIFFFWLVLLLFISRNIFCIRKINSFCDMKNKYIFLVCHFPRLASLKKNKKKKPSEV